MMEAASTPERSVNFYQTTRRNNPEDKPSSWTQLIIDVFFSPVALQSLKDLRRLTYRRFLELFRHMVGLLGRAISPLQGLYLHRTTQHRKTRTNIHTLRGIRTHDTSNQPAKTHASDRTATVTGNYRCIARLNIRVSNIINS
jgi:hypothetical protein